MKKYLFVVRGYFPDISASGNLLKPLVEEMSKENFVCVLSCSSKQVERKHSDTLMFKKIKIGSTSSSLGSKAISFLKKNLLLSIYNEEIENAVRDEIESLDKNYNFDSIIAVTYEEILALMNSSVNSEKKTVFLLEKLPITSTVKIPPIYHYKMAQRKKIEKDMVKHFSKIFVLPIMYKYFSSILNENDSRRLIELEHPMVTNRVSQKTVNDSKIHLIYAGGLDRKQRNPMEILEFFKRVNSQQRISMEFYSYGNMQKSLVEFSRQNSFFHSNNGISSELLTEKIANSDFIITIGNKDRELVPSKIFDCISTGKPIIHFSQIVDDPYKHYLSKYENSLIINMADLSSDVIKEICSFMERTKGKLMDFNKIRKDFEECTPEFVARQIENS